LTPLLKLAENNAFSSGGGSILKAKAKRKKEKVVTTAIAAPSFYLFSFAFSGRIT
jgi:hypothetical protein